MSTMQRVQKYHILTRYSYLDMICSPSAMGLLRSLGVKWRRWRWGEWKGQGHGPRAGEEGKLSAESIFPLQRQDQRQSEVGRRGGALQAWRPSFLSPGLSSLPSAPPPRSEQSGLATSADPPARSADRARGRDQPTDRTAPPHHSHGLQRQAITITSLASTEVIPKFEAKFNYNLHMATNW